MLRSVRLRCAEDSRFGELWELYQDSFPRKERRPFPWQKEAMRREEAFHCLRLEDGGGLAGLMFYWQLPFCRYLEHFAIAVNRRGQGLGRRALELLHRGGGPVILEIEPVVDEGTRRRLSFYQSVGYERLPWPHAQLPFRRGEGDVPMELLSYPTAMTKEQTEAFQAMLRSVVMQYRDA